MPVNKLSLDHIPVFVFFNYTATTEIYTLSLHDALPICSKKSTASNRQLRQSRWPPAQPVVTARQRRRKSRDRKSTRLNSSHVKISYAVFCLKKEKKVDYNLR